MINRLHFDLAAAGIPLDGVSGGPPPAPVRVDYAASATQAQRAQGAALVAGFDWSQAAQDAWEDAQEADLTALRNQTAQALADIGAYLAIAATATTAQVRAEVQAIDQRQRAILRALRRLVGRTWTRG
jgi:hypothetical protein